MFKEGQKWRCRSGAHVAITRIFTNGSILCEDGYSRHPNGKFSQGDDSPYDLMELIGGSGKTVVFPKFTVGQYWKRRDGKVVRLNIIYPNGRIRCGKNMLYDSDGCSKTCEDWDLVEQVSKPTGEPLELGNPPPFLGNPSQFPLPGQTWVCQNMQDVEILSVNADGLLVCSDGKTRLPSGRLVFDLETEFDLMQQVRRVVSPLVAAMDAVGELPRSEIVAPTSKPLSDIEQIKLLYNRLLEASKPPAPSIVVSGRGFRVYGINGEPLSSWTELDWLNDAIEGTGYPVYDVVENHFDPIDVITYEVQP